MTEGVDFSWPHPAWVGMLSPWPGGRFERTPTVEDLGGLWTTPLDHAHVTVQLRRAERGEIRCGRVALDMWGLCVLAPHGRELPCVAVPEEYDDEVGPLIAEVVSWRSVL